MNRKSASFSVLLIGLGTAISALAQDVNEPGGNGMTNGLPEGQPAPTRIEQCAAIAMGVSRLECYDQFLKPRQTQPVQQETDPDLLDAAESIGLDRETLDEEEARPPSLVEQLLARQQALFSYSGTFVRHRANYLLPVTYGSPVNQAPKSVQFGREPLQEDFSNMEAKFQFSVRIPLLTGLFPERTRLWAAYTQLSFWQAFNRDESSPFRESNYEPEIFLSYEPALKLGPGSIDIVSIGINHQSNGLSDPLSRSWNRLLGNVVYSNNRWVMSASPWYRIPESKSEDNNPDIYKYLGYADYNVTYKLPDETTIGMLFRNNLDFDENRSTVRLDYTFPLSDSVRAYVQYFHGWGETLIDYNHHVKRIGIGITIADWL